MTNKFPIYMDYQATTPVDPQVLQVMIPYFTDKFGNASSRHHEFGWIAESAVENARAQTAALIGAQPREVVFTSGATESNNLALQGVARSYRDKGRHLICSAVDHASVLATMESLKSEGYEITFLPVDRNGMLNPETLRAAIRPDTVLVSVIHANNEVGSINAITQLAAIAHEKGCLFHTDASQSAGKITLDVEKMGLDLVSISSHKMYGPKGVGALYIRQRKPKVYLSPIQYGGGHEQGLRSGTLNVPAIVGFGKAAEIANRLKASEALWIRNLRDRLWNGLKAKISDIQLNGPTDDRLSGNLNVYVPGVQGSALMLSTPELAFSSSSACSEADGKPSHVLREMGLTEDQAACSVRFGIGRMTTEEEVDFAIEKITTQALQLREASRAGMADMLGDNL